MKLAICIMHAAFVPARRKTLEALTGRLHEDDDAVIRIEYDNVGRGAWPVARACWEKGIALNASWIVVLNDDALPCEDFVNVARKALAARAENDPVCFYTAHPRAKDLAPRTHWYATFDDLVGVGCALSRDSAREFLAWVDANPKVADFSDDGRINLWAMATRRLIHTTVPSLVDHQLPDASMVGGEGGHARRAIVPPLADMGNIAWSERSEMLGRGRSGNHWELIHRATVVDVSLIEGAYLVEREGRPVSRSPHVFIAMPAARAPEIAVRKSVESVVADLQDHGIGATVFESPGDSLVTRGRHCLVHEFLCSTATHLLQWDDDVECLDPTAVRKMVESSHDVVGGAYPWRDGSGRVVANPLEETVREKYVDVDPRTKCLKVSEVGTGFLLTSRVMLVDLMARHPELMYEADLVDYAGAPMWALFDAHLETRPTGRRRYASEDWRFCQLAREAGYAVHVYYPPKFRHWGKTAHTGHIIEAWGMNGKPLETKAAAE